MPQNEEERPLLEDGTKLIEFEDDDAENPMNWPRWYKISTTALFSLTTLGCTFTSSVFSSAHQSVAKEFGLTELQATLGTSLYGENHTVLKPRPRH